MARRRLTWQRRRPWSDPASGQCFRFYSRSEFNHLNDYPVPEILRIPLHSLLLQMKATNVGDPRTFDLIQVELRRHRLARSEHVPLTAGGPPQRRARSASVLRWRRLNRR